MEYRDGGYGDIGNLAISIILNDLTEDEEKEFRNNLKKENPQQYKEYLEYEKICEA